MTQLRVVTMTEEQLLDAVIGLAHLTGWRAAHFRPAETGKGWRTPVQGDAKGWPDLTLVRERIVYAELKVYGRPLRSEQAAWLDALARAGAAEVYVWDETDWQDGTIERLLARRSPRPVSV
jgi:hypothetical protein